MQAARLLLSLAQASESGAFLWYGTAGKTTRARASLIHGWVHALETNDDPKNERSSRTAERLELLLSSDGAAHFEAEPSPSRWGRCTPFHPGRAIRRGMAGARPAPYSATDDVSVRLTFTPHASCFEETERPSMARLSRAATVGDLRPYLGDTALSRLLDFLRLSGAWVEVVPSAHVLLGVTESASSRELRAAFLQAARLLHPDAHPHASDGERQALGEKFGAVAAAYRSLVK